MRCDGISVKKENVRYIRGKNKEFKHVLSRKKKPEEIAQSAGDNKEQRQERDGYWLELLKEPISMRMRAVQILVKKQKCRHLTNQI